MNVPFPPLFPPVNNTAGGRQSFSSSRLDTGTPIQLEIFNLGPWPVKLAVGMRICQMIFEEVHEVPRAGYRGQFNRQKAFTVPVQDQPPPKE
jgi:hypothetical protein